MGPSFNLKIKSLFERKNRAFSMTDLSEEDTFVQHLENELAAALKANTHGDWW